MSYAQADLIEAPDYNTLVGSNPVTTPGRLNSVWATGGTNAGYGQTPLTTVSTGSPVTANNWASLVNTTANAALHQGSSITSVTAPATGGIITFLSAIPTNLNTVYNNRLNASAQGSTASNSAVYNTTWSSALTFTHTATFSSGDAARYFFNAGGQLAITCSHTTGTGINLLLNNLASNVGTIVLSSPTSGTATIAGISYNGITKIGGGGNAPTISPSTGYYALTTSNTTVFTQTASTGPSGYLGTYIRVIVRSNGTQGSNGDAGSVITVHTIWDEVPDGLVAAANSTTTLTVRPPSSANIANSWGTINLTGTVTGS